MKRFHSDAIFIDLSQPRLLDEMFRSLDRTALAGVDFYFDLTSEASKATMNRTMAANLARLGPLNPLP